MGVWKNVEDLEMNINLDELEAILAAGRDREMRHNKFMAAIQGIDLDAADNDSQSKFDEIKQRAEAKLKGKSVEELEWDMLGIEVEIEE